MKRFFFLGCLLALVASVGAKQNNLSSDQSTFQSKTALEARSSGSPVGPPPKVTICHKGHTIEVAETAVPAHLDHGDSLGPCSGESR